MKLYGSMTSPYARKVRVLLLEKALSCEFDVADAWAANSPVPALNPLGKVPVLVLDDGIALFDSPVIVEYLDALKSPALIPAAGDARWRARRWEALADGILDAGVTRVLESRRPAGQQSSDEIRRQEQKIARAIDFVAHHLPNGPWLMGDRFTLADLAVGVALEYVDFRFPHDWRARHPDLGRWLESISARPAFVETRPPSPQKRTS